MTMRSMKHLALLLREVENQLVVCMRCGMCQSVCPLFAETGRESDVARGKLALLDGLMQEMFKDPAGVSDRLNRCLLCGSCAANCPSGVRVLDIFIKARAILGGYMGLSPLKKLLFRQMLARPALFDRIVEMGSRFQSLFIRSVDDLLGTSCARFQSPLGERHFKALAEVPLHVRTPALNARAGGSGIKVGVFVGCLVDKVFPEVGEAALKVLRHHEVGVFMPDGQACCGIPALSSGDLESYRALVRHNLSKFPPGEFDHLITPCATCTATIRKIWPLMAGDLSAEERERVRLLSEKTLDVSQFLVDVLHAAPAEGVEETGERRPITYHDPCHLRKSLGVYAEPRSLIRANPRYAFKEMAEPDRCCGCGGSFNLQHYELSAAIGRRKRDNIAASGCSEVATGCPACMLQLSDMLSRAGDRVRVRHVVEVYAEALDDNRQS